MPDGQPVHPMEKQERAIESPPPESPPPESPVILIPRLTPLQITKALGGDLSDWMKPMSTRITTNDRKCKYNLRKK